MSCDYIRVTDKFGRDRLEELKDDTVVTVQSGDLVFINELTSNVNLEMINDCKDLLIKFPERTQILLDNMISLLGDNVDTEDSNSLFDELLTKLQFLNDSSVGEVTYSALADIYNLLDSAAAAGFDEVTEENDNTDFGNVNNTHDRRDFRKESPDDNKYFTSSDRAINDKNEETTNNDTTTIATTSEESTATVNTTPAGEGPEGNPTIDELITTVETLITTATTEAQAAATQAAQAQTAANTAAVAANNAITAAQTAANTAAVAANNAITAAQTAVDTLEANTNPSAADIAVAQDAINAADAAIATANTAATLLIQMPQRLQEKQ